MKTSKKEILNRQIFLQEKIQEKGYNIIECGSCGTILLHEINEEKIYCFCDNTMSLSDCPDLYYKGIEENKEFN
jgi:hypothetical protein